MARCIVSTLSALIVLCGSGSSLAQVKPEIIERGKKATALVELSNASGWTGTAFCVDKSGLFLTNAHVVQKATKEAGTISLVLDVGQDTQRSLRARVLRYDDVLDLALLQVVNLPTAGEIKKDAAVVLRSLTKPKEDLVFTPLELGKDANLIELADVTTFGYPFTPATVAGRSAYPAVTVLPNHISSLRKDHGQAAGNPDRQPAQPRQRGRTGARRLGQGDRPGDGNRARCRDEPGDSRGAAGRLPGRARDRLQSTPLDRRRPHAPGDLDHPDGPSDARCQDSRGSLCRRHAQTRHRPAAHLHGRAGGPGHVQADVRSSAERSPARGRAHGSLRNSRANNQGPWRRQPDHDRRQAVQAERFSSHFPQRVDPAPRPLTARRSQARLRGWARRGRAVGQRTLTYDLRDARQITVRSYNMTPADMEVQVEARQGTKVVATIRKPVKFQDKPAVASRERKAQHGRAAADCHAGAAGATQIRLPMTDRSSSGASSTSRASPVERVNPFSRRASPSPPLN